MIILKKINNNKRESKKETIKSLEIELKKENDKLLGIFNFLEDGTYTKEMFKLRSGIISENIAKINQLKNMK